MAAQKSFYLHNVQGRFYELPKLYPNLLGLYEVYYSQESSKGGRESKIRKRVREQYLKVINMVYSNYKEEYDPVLFVVDNMDFYYESSMKDEKILKIEQQLKQIQDYMFVENTEKVKDLFPDIQVSFERYNIGPDIDITNEYKALGFKIKSKKEIEEAQYKEEMSWCVNKNEDKEVLIRGMKSNKEKFLFCCANVPKEYWNKDCKKEERAIDMYMVRIEREQELARERRKQEEAQRKQEEAQRKQEEARIELERMEKERRQRIQAYQDSINARRKWKEDSIQAIKEDNKQKVILAYGKNVLTESNQIDSKYNLTFLMSGLIGGDLLQMIGEMGYIDYKIEGVLEIHTTTVRTLNEIKYLYEKAKSLAAQYPLLKNVSNTLENGEHDICYLEATEIKYRDMAAVLRGVSSMSFGRINDTFDKSKGICKSKYPAKNNPSALQELQKVLDE